MNKTLNSILIMVMAAALSCSGTAAAKRVSSARSADSKYLARIEKKQDQLMSMKRDRSSLKLAFNKGDKSNEWNVPDDTGTIDKKEAVSSDLRYVARLEHKLVGLVKNSIKDIEWVLNGTRPHVMVNNLLPETRFAPKDRGNGLSAGRKEKEL
ncbi:MAG: hypothetical protein KAS86_00295 [Candidatus Omnitrophica bacterium]|nr:hypothetical protein [Candidatus Omnitrophota bacterium]